MKARRLIESESSQFIHLIVKELDMDEEREIVVSTGDTWTPYAHARYVAHYKDDIGENDGNIPAGWGLTREEAIADLREHD